MSISGKKDKTVVVVFREGYIPRIFTNPHSIEDLEKLGTVLINPKIPRNSNPAQWYEERGRIKVREEKVEDLKTFPINKDRSHEKVQRDFRDLLKEYKERDRKDKQDIAEEIDDLEAYVEYRAHRESLKRTRAIEESKACLEKHIAILALTTFVLSLDTIVTLFIQILDLLSKL